MEEAARADLGGRELTNVRGERLGKIDSLVFYGQDDTPSWARVKLGRLGLHKSIVPLENADEVEGKLWLPYETEHVEGAPEIELEGDRLDDEQIDQLCRHYGLEPKTPPSGIEDDDIDLPREARDAKPPALEEGDDSPLVTKRRERMEELDVPEGQEEDVESAEPQSEDEAPEPGSAEHEPESAMPEEARGDDGGDRSEDET